MHDPISKDCGQDDIGKPNGCIQFGLLLYDGLFVLPHFQSDFKIILGMDSDNE